MKIHESYNGGMAEAVKLLSIRFELPEDELPSMVLKWALNPVIFGYLEDGHDEACSLIEFLNERKSEIEAK